MSSGAEDSAASSGEHSPVVSTCNRSSALPRTNPRFVNSNINSNRESRRSVQPTQESQYYVKNVDSIERKRFNEVTIVFFMFFFYFLIHFIILFLC